MKNESPLFKTLGNNLAPSQLISDKEQYKEKIIDHLKENHFIPTNICESIVKQYANDVNWGRMFCQRVGTCAERILSKYKAGTEPINLKAD